MATNKQTNSKTYSCCKCGTEYKSLERNFRASNSEVFTGRNNRLPICNKCLEHYYKYYLELYENNISKTVKRVCMMFDIYFNEKIVQQTVKGNRGSSIIGGYIAGSNLQQYAGKTYDNTIDEERTTLSIGLTEQEQTQENIEISQEVVNLFGIGFSPNDYIFLDKQYKDWCQRVGAQKKAQEELIKILCFNQLDLYKARIQGNSTKDIEDTYRKNLEAGGWKPSKDKDATSEGGDVIGVLIKFFENENPIPEVDPEFKDIDNIGMLTDIFFKGHTAKCLHIPGSLSKLYDKFIRKYSVTPPTTDEFDDDDTELLFDEIFSEKANVEIDNDQ